MQQPSDIRLNIEIKNKDPLELIDLTKSLIALGTQFNRFVVKSGISEVRESKLYVKEIKTGSIIFDLYEYSPVGIIPFLENANTIKDFATHLKNVVNYFLKKEGEKPEMDTADYKEFSSILNPIAKDSASQFNLSTNINGDVHLHFHVDSIAANALQNIFTKEMSLLKTPEQNEVTSKVLFYWHQAKSDVKAVKGNKGVIESISKKPLNVIFDNDAIKEQMLKGEANPLTHVFVVDVKVDTVMEIPSVYKIMNIHQVIDRD